MLLAAAIVIGLALLVLLFIHVASLLGWPLRERIVERHERQRQQYYSRQPWE